MTQDSTTMKALHLGTILAMQYPLVLIPSYYPELQFPDTKFSCLSWRFFKAFTKIGVGVGITSTIPMSIALVVLKVPEPTVKKYSPFVAAISAQLCYQYFISNYDRNSAFWMGAFLSLGELFGTVALMMSSKKDTSEVIDLGLDLLGKTAGNLALGMLTSGVMDREMSERIQILGLCTFYRQLEAFVDAKKYLTDEDDPNEALLVSENMRRPLKYISITLGCGMLAYALSKN